MTLFCQWLILFLLAFVWVGGNLLIAGDATTYGRVFLWFTFNVLCLLYVGLLYGAGAFSQILGEVK